MVPAREPDLRPIKAAFPPVFRAGRARRVHQAVALKVDAPLSAPARPPRLMASA